jgi:hypothetical protein
MACGGGSLLPNRLLRIPILNSYKLDAGSLRPDFDLALSQTIFDFALIGSCAGTIPGAICYQMMKRELEPTEARQAVKVAPMKYVLGFGTAGAAIGLLAAWVLLGG